jgi:hypothetical protein
MQLLQASRLRHNSSSHNDPRSRSSEPYAQDGTDYVASRHDSQLLAARAVPADPYTAWLERREADRRSSAVTASTVPVGRFG